MSRLLPWSGWIAGLLGWMLSHQLGSDLAQLDCGRAEPVTMLLIGASGAALAVAGGLLSLSIWRMPAKLDQPHAGTRRFAAGTGALAAAIFLLAILFQTISSFLIPQCHG
jgi:hypothetical protein